MARIQALPAAARLRQGAANMTSPDGGDVQSARRGGAMMSRAHVLVAAALSAQLLLGALLPPPAAPPHGLPPAPDTSWLRAAAIGEPEAAARVLMLQVQTFDDGLRWRDLDYAALALWLDRIVDLDPRGQAPLLAAGDVYGAVHDPARVRIMLDWIARRFPEDPDRRWPWLAHAALVARHHLHDADLSRRYAQAIRQHATGPHVPAWARELEPLLAQGSERDAARLLAGALLASRPTRDAAQLQWLERRLQHAEPSTSLPSEPPP